MELNVRVAPTAPVVGPVTLAVNASGEIATSSNAFAVAALWSVTVRVTLYVPLTAKLVVKLDAIPDAGLPPVTAQA
jgi:hypothetical protein